MTDVLPGTADRTLPMSVANTGFMLDRLGQDCSPLQYLRELTQNSIEAILRTPKQLGEIVWDVDWALHDLNQVYKLSVVDNGDGMAGD
jgi:DNA topoisomerase VI subunit B